MKDKPKKKVRFIKPRNVLKQKVGTGGIDEALLEKGQALINTTEYDFAPHARQFLNEIAQYAREARESLKQSGRSNDNFKEAKEKIIAPVMQLKANGGMFRFQLLSDVADIALQFLEAIERANDDTFEVLAAHQNTLKVIIANNLRGDGGREGYALIKELDGACQRYFSKYGDKEP